MEKEIVEMSLKHTLCILFFMLEVNKSWKLLKICLKLMIKSNDTFSRNENSFGWICNHIFALQVYWIVKVQYLLLPVSFLENNCLNQLLGFYGTCIVALE